MLKKTEVDECLYKMMKHFVDRSNTTINTKQNSNINVLFDSGHRMMAMSNNPSSIRALSTFNSEFCIGFYTEEMTEYPNIDIQKNLSWKYKLNVKKDAWEENLNFYSHDELYNAVLTNQKAAALDIMFDKLEAFRRLIIRNMDGQDLIYMAKYLEAKEIIEKNIMQDDTSKYVFTSAYAKLKDITLQESAKLIIVQHDIRSGFLSENETLRLKYKDLICKETDISNLKKIVNNFIVENSKYGSSL